METPKSAWFGIEARDPKPSTGRVSTGVTGTSGERAAGSMKELMFGADCHQQQISKGFLSLCLLFRGRVSGSMCRDCGYSHTHLLFLFSLAFTAADFALLLTPNFTSGHSAGQLLPWTRSQGGVTTSRAGSSPVRGHPMAPGKHDRHVNAGEAQGPGHWTRSW